MHEIDFLAVGDGDRSGLAIAMRFTRADTGDLAHVIVDGGFQDDGDDLVGHIRAYYGTAYGPPPIDVVVLTHPDGDHIGGLGTVCRELSVGCLVAHRPAEHGGASLRASAAVEELVSVAADNGVDCYEPFAGLNFFDGGLVVAGPDQTFYEEMVDQQVDAEATGKAAPPAPGRLVEAMAKMSARVMQTFPVEVQFDDGGGTNPRNNSSAVVDLRTADDKRLLFTGDAGVPALDHALDYLDGWGRTNRYPDLVQVPHHGSRKNVSTVLLDRMLGPQTTPRDRAALISISEKAAKDPRYPSPRVTNSYGRRGYRVYETRGRTICEPLNAPSRTNWGPVDPLPALDESIDER